jgi:predicted amidophosphoribosyltransferase
MSFFHSSFHQASSHRASSDLIPAQHDAVSDISRIGKTLLDLVLPPQCLKCGIIVNSSDTLCLSCWRDFSFTTPPWCNACGLVLEFDPGADGLCASCARHAPAFERARSVFAYNEHFRTLILSFKNRDRTDTAPTYARWMKRAGADLLADADFMVPVPLHWSRLYWRRYNQSALLALTLARGPACWPFLIYWFAAAVRCHWDA